MERVFDLENGPKVLIKLPGNQEKKMMARWSFSRWKNFGEMLADSTFAERLLDIVREVIADGAAALERGFAEPITVTCSTCVVGLDLRVRRQDGLIEVLVNKLYPCTEP